MNVANRGMKRLRLIFESGREGFVDHFRCTPRYRASSTPSLFPTLVFFTSTAFYSPPLLLHEVFPPFFTSSSFSLPAVPLSLSPFSMMIVNGPVLWRNDVIAWLSLNFILETSWVALYSDVCQSVSQSVRHRCHPTKSLLFPIYKGIQALCWPCTT